MYESKPWTKISLLLQIAESKYAKISERQYGPHGITSSQMKVLILLDQSGPMRVSDISETLGIVKSNVSNICSRLEKTGYVTHNRQKNDRKRWNKHRRVNLPPI